MKIIWLTQGQFTLVDDGDYQKLIEFKWYALKRECGFYAVRNRTKEDGSQTMVLMHREILNLKDSNIRGDHADHNGLNNQRYNLRVATHSENNANRKSAKNSSSKYLGVALKDKRWIVQIQNNKNLIYIGTFGSEIDGAIAYNKKAIELHGEFANLNSIP